MKLKLVMLVAAAVALSACNTHVEDPWVQNEDYLKSERMRSAQTAEQLDRRISGQRDR